MNQVHHLKTIRMHRHLLLFLREYNYFSWDLENAVKTIALVRPPARRSVLPFHPSPPSPPTVHPLYHCTCLPARPPARPPVSLPPSILPFLQKSKVNLYCYAALREYLHNAKWSECRFTLQKLILMINMCNCFAIPSEKKSYPQFTIRYLRKKCEPMKQVHDLTTVR